MMAINANEVFVSFLHNHILSANESLVDKRGKNNYVPVFQICIYTNISPLLR